jgi:hypothetical protein
MSRHVHGSTGRWGLVLLASGVFCSVGYVACGSPDRSFTEDMGGGGHRDSGADVSTGGHPGTGGGQSGGHAGTGGGSTGTGGNTGTGGAGTGGSVGSGGSERDTGADDAPTTGI